MKSNYKSLRRNKRKAKPYSTIQNLADLTTLITGQLQDGLSSVEEYAQEICAFYLSIIANMPNHVYWLDRNCILRGGNNNLAHFFGLKSASDLAGLTYEDMSKLANWTEGQGQSFKNAELEVMSTGVPRLNVEEPVVYVNQQPRYYISNKVPLYNNKSEIIGVLGITTDVTDLKEAKDQAEAASRAKSEFIANISHDLRTPLTGVVTMSDSLKEKLKGSESEQEATWLHESGEQILEFCNNILDTVSAENYTEQDLEETCFDLHQLILAIGNLEMPKIKSKGLDFVAHVPDAPLYLIKDKTKLYRILLNLLGNAIKFTKKGHVGIEVKLIEQNSDNITLKFCVFDTGIGLKPEIQGQIFDRFFRVSPSYKGDYEGHGLGLYIAQKYVRLLGADRIYVECEEGKGCKFFFTLLFQLGDERDVLQLVPRQKQKNQQASQFSSSATLTPTPLQSINDNSVSTNAPLLLLIEDSKPALRGLEVMIKKTGCRFKSAERGEKGVELARTYDFDLIISDIGLPDISGIEVTKTIRAWEKQNHKKRVPIVALSGHAAQLAEPECLQAGMDKVLTKPASLDNIKNLILQFTSKNNNNDSKYIQQPTASMQEISTPSTTSLGPDLPDTEEELFILDQYSYFSIKAVTEIYGENSNKLIEGSLNLMIKQIPKDKQEITEAFLAKNWARVENLAHRMKGGAAYCGTIRMRYACQYLERYIKAGHKTYLEKLYYQLIHVLDKTKDHLEKWLKNE
jgi:two-component system aerobic respiration control sensor histidine kinase ArcB